MTIYQTLTLVRSGPHLPWGFRLASDSIRPEIGRITADSISSRFLTTGQALIEVNSVNIESNTNAEITNLIKQAGNVLHLKVEKLNPSIDDHLSQNNGGLNHHYHEDINFPQNGRSLRSHFDDTYLTQLPPKPLVSENFLPAPPQWSPATCVVIPGHQMPENRLRRASSVLHSSHSTSQQMEFGTGNSHVSISLNRNRTPLHSGYESDSYYSCPAPPSKTILAPNKATLLTRSQRNIIRNQNINQSTQLPINRITVMTNTIQANENPPKNDRTHPSTQSNYVNYQNFASPERYYSSNIGQALTFPRNRQGNSLPFSAPTFTPQVKNKRSVSFSFQREPRSEFSGLSQESNKNNGKDNVLMDNVLNEFESLMLNRKEEREQKRRIKQLRIKQDSIQEEDSQNYTQFHTYKDGPQGLTFSQSYLPATSFANEYQNTNSTGKMSASYNVPNPNTYSSHVDRGSTDF